jgi:hypothetical protein
MKKNCLLMFGHMRYIDVNYINNFFSDFDVFIHSSNTHDFIDQINSITNLKQYESSTYDFSYLPEYKQRGRVRNIHSMWRSVNICGSMKIKHEELMNQKYERVLIQRSDLIFNSSIPYDSIDYNTICTHDTNYKNDCFGFVNDHMCLTNSENADKYTSLFNYITDYLNRPIEFVSEIILRVHLEEMKLKHSMCIFDYSIKARNIHGEPDDWKSIDRRNH